MKRKFWLFIISFTVGAVHDQEAFLQANKAYQEGDFVTACTLYEKISHKTPEILYNMGNCFFKQEKPFEAQVHWEKALRHAGAALAQAIAFNKQELQKTYGLEAKKNRWIFEKLNTISRSYSLFVWQLLLLFFVCLLLLNMLWNSRKKIIFFVGIMGCIAILSVVAIIKHARMHNHVFVVDSDASLFVGPRDDFAIIGSVKKAQDLKILEKNNGWYKVKSMLHEGWVFQDKGVEV